MGGLFSTPKAPVVPTPPPAAAPPTAAGAGVKATAQVSKQKSTVAALSNDTNPTGPQGLSAPPVTAGATLLGGTK